MADRQTNITQLHWMLELHGGEVALPRQMIAEHVTEARELLVGTIASSFLLSDETVEAIDKKLDNCRVSLHTDSCEIPRVDETESIMHVGKLKRGIQKQGIAGVRVIYVPLIGVEDELTNYNSALQTASTSIRIGQGSTLLSPEQKLKLEALQNVEDLRNQVGFSVRMAVARRLLKMCVIEDESLPKSGVVRDYGFIEYMRRKLAEPLLPLVPREKYPQYDIRERILRCNVWQPVFQAIVGDGLVQCDEFMDEYRKNLLANGTFNPLFTDRITYTSEPIDTTRAAIEAIYRRGVTTLRHI